MSETKDERAILKAMAIAMAAADGKDPHSINPRTKKPFWDQYIFEAAMQYHAHLAMLQAIEDLDRREASEFTRRLDKQGE